MSIKLTRDLIFNKLGIDKIESVKNINLYGLNIDDISLLSEMNSLEIISLNSNKIKELKSFKNLKNLKELYLQENMISDFSQIEFLKNCKKLEILDLTLNPITQQQNYRQKILKILPFLKKLDDFENNNNFIPNKFPFHQNPLMLFKKILPKRRKKPNNEGDDNNKINDLNMSVNLDEINNKRNTVNINNIDNKNNILNKSFKKNFFGKFMKIGNNKNDKDNKKEKDIKINLDLSLDYSKNNINRYENIDPNKSTCFEDCHSNNNEMNAIRNKYNKKVIGDYKKSQIKNYQSKLLTYNEFDVPDNKKEKKEKNCNDNIDNNKFKINEGIVIKSIQILLDTLNLSELKCVNEDINNLLKVKKD